MDIDEPEVHAGGDLENELREFLESGGSGMHTSNPVDDNNIVAQLLLNWYLKWNMIFALRNVNNVK